MCASALRYSESAPGSGNVAKKSDHSRKYGHSRRKAAQDRVDRGHLAVVSRSTTERRTQSMAGAMRKMAVYLGLVEDDGYDGRGFDPDDDFEPELDPEPERDRRRHEPSHQSQPHISPEGTNRSESCSLRAQREPVPFARRGMRTTRAHRPRGIHHT